MITRKSYYLARGEGGDPLAGVGEQSWGRESTEGGFSLVGVRANFLRWDCPIPPEGKTLNYALSFKYLQCMRYTNHRKNAMILIVAFCNMFLT